MTLHRSPEAQKMINVLQDKNRQLTDKNIEFQKLVDETADCKRTYLVALATEITTLKIAGEKITIIRDLAKGDKKVADFGYAWDVKEGVLLACRERIKDLRESIGTARSVLTYNKSEMEIEAKLHGPDGS